MKGFVDFTTPVSKIPNIEKPLYAYSFVMIYLHIIIHIWILSVSQIVLFI